MLPLTRHGWRELLIGSVVLAIFATLLGWRWAPLALLMLPPLVFLFAFFRDPHRAIPAEQHVMVSPADGVVSDITQLPHEPLLGGPAVRIGIFLSVFNVHVNRSPCDGQVLKVIYKKGRFINAMKHSAASDENESNTLLLGDAATGEPIAVVRQIVGLIARRIVSTKVVGQRVARGERIGMIKFGSRTELTIPLSLQPQVRVKPGQKVRGGADVVASIGRAVHVPADAMAALAADAELGADRRARHAGVEVGGQRSVASCQPSGGAGITNSLWTRATDNGQRTTDH